ncbi:MAG: DoxX family protein [Halobacteriovoraceae bacterium]|nr:DoxX family protein [Halobacteriovoraceae bacterium]
MSKKRVISWIFQLIVASVLLPIGWGKLIANPGSVTLFTQLGMEPSGRIIIGVLEVLVGLFMLSNTLSAIGAILANAIMLGAIIAHCTVLGFEFQGDGGKHVLLLTLVILSSLAILGIRRKQLPFFGKHLD